MGAAIDAVGTAVNRTVRNPLLIILTVVVGFFALILSSISVLIPFFGQFLPHPIFQVVAAGVIGMVFIATKEQQSPSLSTFTDVIGATGGRVIGVSLLEQAIYFVISLIGLVILVFFGVGMGALAGGSEVSSAIAGMGILLIAFSLVAVLGLLVLGLIFQFLTVSIVIGDYGVMEAFSESWDLVKSDPVSTLGFSILRGGLFIVGSLGIFMVIAVGSLVSEEIGFVLGMLVMVAVFPLMVTLNFVYLAEYYMARRPGTLETEEHDNVAASE